MIENIKTMLWKKLKQKEVSLLMLIDHAGNILWHRGRDISGKKIDDSLGFSRTLIRQAMAENKVIEKSNVYVMNKEKGLSASACNLNIKSVFILPLDGDVFLYVDSGIKESFSIVDMELFKFAGELLTQVLKKIKANDSGYGNICGSSSAMQEIRNLAAKFALEDEPVLLLGESGVGKSYIAEIIHHYSGKEGKFVTIHTPSIPENLFESEIFGHKKGSFTDAHADRKGFVDEAQNGTLFFDEIAEVPVSFQAKLLRFMETRKYTIVGDSQEHDAQVRILAATNRNLDQAMADGNFREDLYYRLQILEIVIPPLRQRKEDIRDFVMSHLHLLRGKLIGDGFWDVMMAGDWKGNIRQLKTVLTRAGILLDSPISGDKLQLVLRKHSISDDSSDSPVRIDQVWQKIQTGHSFWEVVHQPFLDRDLNRHEVKEIIARALKDNCTFKTALPVLNIIESDYKKFLNFIEANKLKP